MDSSRTRTLEVCIASRDDARAAADGGADRLELNVALEVGGLTPSVGLLREVKEAVRVPVIVMVRPRAGGFCYSPDEQSLILRDAEMLLDAGADGIAAGALLPNGTVDCVFWNEVMRRFSDREVVFHRAFDVVADQELALRSLIDLGTTRVLTSGGRKTALAGSNRIAQLVQYAAGRIQVLPGSGIVADHIGELMARTGCDQVHGSFAEELCDSAGSVTGARYRATSRVKVAAARAALDAAGI
jgi:copper homeostasis protein